MATYSFETVSTTEALGIGPADRLIFASGSAYAVDVWYDLPAATVAIVLAGRSVTFGASISAVSTAGNFVFPDGSALFIGGDGGDARTGGATNDALFGGPGADSLEGGAGRDFLQGNMGADTLRGGGDGDAIYGGRDNDVIDLGPGANFGHGNMGDDTIIAADGADTLLGGQNNDQISAGNGTNYVSGDLGDDRIATGVSNDTIFGGDGDDRISDLGGANYMDGGVGNDTIFVDSYPPNSFALGVLIGGADNDIIASGRNGDESISGGDGNDNLAAFGLGLHTIHAGDGDDIVQVAVGVSVAYGGAGADFMVQTITKSGNHTFHGEAGNDLIVVEGNCTALGGDGEDRLIVQNALGNTLSGGAGADQFEFKSHAAISGLSIQAVIEDFHPEDRLKVTDLAQGFGYAETTAVDFAAAVTKMADMAQSGVKVAAFQIGGDVLLLGEFSASPGMDLAVRLQGVNLNDISEANFVF